MLGHNDNNGCLGVSSENCRSVLELCTEFKGPVVGIDIVGDEASTAKDAESETIELRQVSAVIPLYLNSFKVFTFKRLVSSPVVQDRGYLLGW